MRTHGNLAVATTKSNNAELHQFIIGCDWLIWSFYLNSVGGQRGQSY